MASEQFLKMINDLRRSRDDLLQIRENALSQGKAEEAKRVEAVLDERSPGWNRKRTRRGGATPTTVTFKGESAHFDTAKEAYVWLINKFLFAYPEVLDGEDWLRGFVAEGGRGARFFARDLASLFPTSSDRASDPSNYRRVGGGWLANLNLSNRQKFSVLCKLAAGAELSLGKDWDWDVEGKTPADLVDLADLL